MSVADLPATDTQRKLIDVFRMQLGLSTADIEDMIDAHSGDPEAPITRKVAGAIITDLQRMKLEHQRRNRA